MDWAGRTKGRGNAGKTAGSFFHPSGPSEFGYLIQRKGLIYHSKLARGAGRTPFHPVNPGLLSSVALQLLLRSSSKYTGETKEVPDPASSPPIVPQQTSPETIKNDLDLTTS